MFRSRLPLLSAVTAAVLLLSVNSCKDETTGGGGGFTPEQLEAYLQANTAAAAAGAIDAMTRLVIAIQGGGMDGVTLTPSGNVVQAELLVDLDGNGSRETTVTGSATFSSPMYDLNDGATFAISDIEHPEIESASASADASVAGTGAIQLLGTASVRSSDGPPVDVTDFGVTVEYYANFIFGYAEAQVGGTDICVYFEEDGAGGWQMRVEVGEDEFIV